MVNLEVFKLPDRLRRHQENKFSIFSGCSTIRPPNAANSPARRNGRLGGSYLREHQELNLSPIVRRTHGLVRSATQIGTVTVVSFHRDAVCCQLHRHDMQEVTAFFL